MGTKIDCCPSCGRECRVRGGADEILQERYRQIDVEGWTAEHDDQHDRGELAAAARAYLFAVLCRLCDEATAEEMQTIPNDWPAKWSREWWKPSSDPIRNLVKAGALIAAEIDRLRRKARA